MAGNTCHLGGVHMCRSLLGVVCLTVALAHAPSESLAAPFTIDFEALSDGDPVGALGSPAVTFSNATVLTAGISLNELDFPPSSGSNVAHDSGGPMRLDFTAPIESFSGRFTYIAPLTILFFNPSANLLGSVASLFADNTLSAGGAANEIVQGVFAGTKFITITGDPLGGSFTVDDVFFQTSSVPEPCATVLTGTALAVWLRRRRSHARART